MATRERALTPEEYAAAYAQAQREQQAAQQPAQGQPQARKEEETKQATTKPTGPQIAFLPPGGIERSFILLIYAGMLLLALFSVFGTFYGLRSVVAPLRTPWQMFSDAAALPGVFSAALLVQIVLTLAQYGARVRARREARWWLFYLVVLAISVYYNAQAYLTPITALNIPVLGALGIIIAADVLPEFMAVKH